MGTLAANIQWTYKGVTGGSEVFRTATSDFLDKLKNAAPLFESISRNVLEPAISQVGFEAEGGVDGNEQWEDLAKATRDDRERLGYPPEHPILERSGKLRTSFTPGGEGHIEEFLPDTGYWGSEIDYAVYHQTGTPNARYPMPARRILYWNAEMAAQAEAEMVAFGQRATQDIYNVSASLLASRGLPLAPSWE